MIRHFAYPGLILWRAASRNALRRFRRRVKNAESINNAALRAILSAAKNTEIARRYDFGAIVDSPDLVDEYRSRVPLRDYAAHADDIQSLANGAADVLFAGAPKMFVATSGTSSDPKLLPMTRAQQNRTLEYIALLAPAMRWEAAPELRLGQRSINLMLASSPGNRLPCGLQMGMSSGAGLRKVLRAAPYIWTSPAEVFELTEHNIALYLHALFGLLDESAGSIEAVFGTHIVSWAAMLMSQQDQLIDDIAHGRINSELNLTAAFRQQIERQLTPNPERAKAVAAAFAAGEEGILPRLWPQLRVLSTIVSGAFAVSLPRLRLLTGDQVRICGSCLGATEGMLGINLWPGLHERYALTTGAAFYEFLPLEDINSPTAETSLLKDLRPGEKYEVVLSNFAGLYRYRMGDVVRIVGFEGEAPVFEFDHRLGDVMDLAGEKTTERHTQSVVLSMASEHLGSAEAISNFTLTSDCTVTPFRYRLYLEVADSALAQLQDCEELAEEFDRMLQQVNLSYRTLARVNQRLGAPSVRLVPSGTFARLEEHQYRARLGVSRNQIKVPRVLKDPEQIALLDAEALNVSAH